MVAQVLHLLFLAYLLLTQVAEEVVLVVAQYQQGQQLLEREALVVEEMVQILGGLLKVAHPILVVAVEALAALQKHQAQAALVS
jgi:uncharacterized protein YydD (DUF2326 family)